MTEPKKLPSDTDRAEFIIAMSKMNLSVEETERLLIIFSDYGLHMAEESLEGTPDCDNCDERRGDGDDGRYDAWN